MHRIVEHHHYREGSTELDRVERVERAVFDLIMSSGLPDAERQSSLCWEARHHACTAQLGRLLADKRGLRADYCVPAMALHDVYAILTGSYKNHARLGMPIAGRVLAEGGGFAEAEVDLILRMIGEHSDKDVYSADPYVEFCKDADLLDCFLYDRAADQYLATKPPALVREYFRRWRRVREELGLRRDPRFEVLDSYREGWLEPLARGPFAALVDRAVAFGGGGPPSACFRPLLLVWGTPDDAVLLASADDISQAVTEMLRGLEGVPPGVASLVRGSERLGRQIEARDLRELPPIAGPVPRPLRPAEGLALVAIWPGFEAFDVRYGREAETHLAALAGLPELTESLRTLGGGM